MEPADEIRATLELLRERGWHQGSFNNGKGALCWLGAAVHIPSASNCRDLAAFVSAALSLFPARVDDDRPLGAQVAQFNDHLDTTFEDIELVAKHAIHALEED